MIQVWLNGETRELPPAVTVADLLSELQIATRAVAVERNEQLVPRSDHASTSLVAGDRLEIVTLVGGG